MVDVDDYDLCDCRYYIIPQTLTIPPPPTCCRFILHLFCPCTHSYLVTFLFPSTALMPLEYCLPLMDVADTVEDLEFVENYRNFIIERTGVELIIES
jgi:hypothetical protein